MCGSLPVTKLLEEEEGGEKRQVSALPLQRQVSRPILTLVL